MFHRSIKTYPCMNKVVIFICIIFIFNTKTAAQSLTIVKDCRAEFSFMSNGLTLMFHDLSSVTAGGPITSWLWEFGDGTTSTQQHPTKTYSQTGTFNVKLTINTAGGCSDKTSQNVTTCQLTITTTNGTCNAQGQVPVAVNVTNQLSNAGNVTFNLDGVALTGSYPITPQSPVNQTINVVGDGLSHTLIVNSTLVAGCSATKTFNVADCGSNCFLGSMNVVPSGGTTKIVTVNDNFFQPVQTTIVLGDIVRFQWNQGGHTSTSDATTGADAWNSGNQNAGFVYDVKINNPGVHRFYCQPHGSPNGAGMAGSIVANCPPNNVIPVTISFNTSQANAAGFLLFLDNVQQGIARQYSGIGAQTLTFNLPGDGQTHTLKIQDVATPTCTVSKTYQSPNCGAVPQCQLSLSNSTLSTCNAQNQVTTNLTINAINGGTQGFNLLIDNTLYTGSPFTYNASGTTLLNNIALAGNGQTQVIKVQDITNMACNASVSVATPNCNLPCAITNLSATSGISTTHTIEVRDFEFSPKFKTITLGDVVKFVWTGAVAHTSQSDATTGANTWNSGLLNTGGTYQITLTSLGSFPYYCAPHGGVGGQGMSGAITVIPNCNNGKVAVNLSFATANIGASGYNIKVDGAAYVGSPFTYVLTGNTTNTININGDGNAHNIEIQDVVKTNCIASVSVNTPNCNFVPPCNIVATAGAISACSGNNVTVPITITSQNTGNQGFNVKINNILYQGSPFPYNASGITQLNLNLVGNGTTQSIEISDATANTCKSTLSVVTPNCTIPTSITNLTANTGAGVSHTIEVKDFEFVPKNQNVTLGDTVKFVWTGQVAHTASSDATSGANSFDSGLQSKGFIYQFKPTALGDCPYYCKPHGAVGGIGMAGKISVLPKCNNGKVAVNLSFNVTNGGAQGYDVLIDNIKINTVNYTYTTNPNKLTVNVIGDGKSHSIIVRDISNNSIFASTSVTTNDCNFTLPCSLALQTAQAGNCTVQNKVPYHLMVTPQNAGNQGFNVRIDNVLLAGSPFPYNGTSMAMMMVELAGDGKSHTIVVEDKANPNCNTSQNITTPNCTVPCTISNLKLENNINASTHIVEVQDFKFFPKEITINKGDVVKFVWIGQVPHTATSDATSGANAFDSGLLSNGATYFVTMTSIGSVPYYCKPHGAVGGIGMAGKITVIEPCNNNKSNVKITFNQTAGSVNGYKILVDNILNSQNNLYANINPTTINVAINGDGKAHFIKIEDMGNSNCAAFDSIVTPNCSVNPPICNLDLQQVEVDTCVLNQVKISLKVAHSNVGNSQGFNVFLNNSKINNLPFAYHNSGITNINFQTQGNGNQLLIEIKDAINNICRDTQTIILPNCKNNNLPCLIENLSASSNPSTHIVEVRDFDYFPKVINVIQGDTIKFVWTGVVKHTATSNNFSPNGNQGWNSGLLGQGASYKIVMTNIGENGYYCIPHGGPNGIGQSGIINVLPLCDSLNDVNVKLNFSTTKGSPQGYKIYVDGNLISPNPFIYNNLQGENQKLIKVKGDGQTHTITVQDQVVNFCAATTFLTTPTCNAPCVFQNVKITPTKNEKRTVLVKDFVFEPKLLACHVGDTILFDFVGQIPHTVTSDKITGAGSFDSGILTQGAKYQLIISTEGNHKYYCKPHGGPNGIGMAGEIMAHNLCENGKIHTNIEFEANGTHSGSYNIFVDGKKENAVPLPILNGKNMKTIFVIGDGKNHIIEIKDNQKTDCKAMASVKTENCGNSNSCDIMLKISQLSSCNEQKKVPYQLEVICEDMGKLFDVLVDGLVLQGSPFPCPTTGSVTLPLLLNGDGKVHIIKIQSINNPDCSKMEAVTTPLCSDSCKINSLKIINIGHYQRHRVEVKDFEFSPKDVNVTVGDTIEFAFVGQIPHTVTSDSVFGAFVFDSGLLPQNSVYQLFVSKKGTFPYYCKPHGAPNGIGMAGRIIASPLCEKSSLPTSIYFEGGSPNQAYKVLYDGKLITPLAIQYQIAGKNKITLNLLADSLLHTLKIVDLLDSTCSAALQFRMPNCKDICSVVQPNFTYSVEKNNLVKFNNLSLGNATKWLWGFGEGGTSTLKNPTYQYKSSGSFEVCLLAHATLTQCLSDPFCKTINLQTIDNQDIKNDNQIIVYPNPTTEILYINSEDYQQPFVLYNLYGPVILQGNILPQYIDLKGFPKGFYFLKVNKIVKKIELN